MLNSLVLGVLGLSVYAALLVVGRALVFRTRLYRPMLLNIALALAPGAVILPAGAVITVDAVPVALRIAIVTVLAVVWLLLLPNAGYLVTELNMSHRREGETVPMWFDIVLIVTLAMSGVASTLLSVFVGHLMYSLTRHGDIAANLTLPDSLGFVAALLLLVGFGVFIGRHVRVNSWDVLRPWRLARTLWRGLRPQVGAAIAFTVLYAIFLGWMYLIVVGSVIHGLELLEA